MLDAWDDFVTAWAGKRELPICVRGMRTTRAQFVEIGGARSSRSTTPQRNGRTPSLWQGTVPTLDAIRAGERNRTLGLTSMLTGEQARNAAGDPAVCYGTANGAWAAIGRLPPLEWKVCTSTRSGSTAARRIHRSMVASSASRG